MVDKSNSGDLFGIPYNFERPSMRRMFAAYWQPGESMIVEKPFGIGYSLNLANWRSWIVLVVVGILLWQERQGEAESKGGDLDDEPVEIIVDDD